MSLGRGPLGVATLLFAAVSVLAGLDLAADVAEGAPTAHRALEAALLAVALAGFAWLLVQLAGLSATMRRVQAEAREQAALAREHREANRSLEERLHASSAEADRWRSEVRGLVRGLGEAIDAQLERWELTDAEKEVALLLLKGLSHKEIAAARGTTDQTTRQQAKSLYRKAGIAGRNELSAFFLEDLWLPNERPGAS